MRSGRERDSANEVLVQLTFQSQTHADAGAVAVLRPGLLETLAAYPNVAGEPESTDRRRQSRYFFLVILGGKGGVSGVSANIRNVGLQLGHRVRSLIGCRSCRAGLGLCVLQLVLCLLQLLLRLLQGGVALCHLALQVLNLLLLLGQSVTQCFEIVGSDLGSRGRCCDSRPAGPFLSLRLGGCAGGRRLGHRAGREYTNREPRE